MSLLQYTSNEMFSSTELIRKSKMVFDKINNKEIEKAIILRDGKPSFMLLDFVKYEELINEYLLLKKKLKKETLNNSISTKEKIVKKIEIDNNELEKALSDIDSLEFNLDKVESKIDKKEALKEFWE